MASIPVSTNNLERWALMELAKKRNARKESKGIKSQKVDPGITDVQLHYVGLKAEYAVAKLIGVEIDLENTYEGDGGIDINYRGLTIDVKLSTRDLKHRLDKKVVADVIVLVQPLMQTTSSGAYHAKAIPDPMVDKKVFAWNNVMVIGWISREEFLSTCSVANFGHFDCNVVTANNMRDMSTLRAYAASKHRTRMYDEIFTE